MKIKNYKRLLASVLSMTMAASLMPASAFAKETVTTKPGSTSIEVQYFSSTLYNWNESSANSVTLARDKYTTVSYEQTTSPSWSELNFPSGNNNNDATQNTDYYVYDKTTNDYYQVKTRRYRNNNTSAYTYTIVATIGGTNVEIATRPRNTNSQIIVSNTRFEYTVVENDFESSNVLNVYTRHNSGDYQNKGFYFTQGSNKPSSGHVPAYSNWNGTTNAWHYYSGLAADKLSESKNVPFSNDVIAADLFPENSNTYTSVYKNIEVPFYLDSDGYYNLNSDTHAVYFDGTVASNTKLAIADLPAAHPNQYNSNNIECLFDPFVKVSSSNPYTNAKISDDKTTTKAYRLDGSAVWGFGMVTEVPFQMTDNGLDSNGKPIEFQFSGDDDVWVYVDDTLVLDIGGTHNAISGYVNFQTGDVYIDCKNYNSIGDMRDEVNASSGAGASISLNSCSTTHTTVVDTNTANTITNKNSGDQSDDNLIIKQKNIYEKLGTTLTGFAAQGQHTLKIYYLERGQGRSNGILRFNLPQRDYVSVSKNIDNTFFNSSKKISEEVMNSLNEIDFSFTLYHNDKDGNAVSTANRSYSILDKSGAFLGTASTDSNGTFKLKNGQTAMFRNIVLDEQNSYYVVENGLSDRWHTNWSAGTNMKNPTISGKNGSTSDTVTATGSTTDTDYISFVCTNTVEDRSDIELHSDTIVLDYGLPTEVDVLKNDVLNGNTIEEMTIDADEVKNGTVELVNNKICYTPNKEMKSIDVVKYSVQAKDSLTHETLLESATLTIIPATSVYYEENFSTIVKSSGAISWESIGTAKGGYQEPGVVGTTNDSTYGSDTVYLSNLGDSYGTAVRAVTNGYAAQFRYDFTGTGTAIYSRISDDSAYIGVEIRKYKNSTGTYVKGDDYDVVQQKYIDTRVLVDKGVMTSTYYNIPVFMEEGLNYGSYTAVVTVYKQGLPIPAGGSGNTFVLDGIRVFNPMSGDATAEAAYAQDGESNNNVVNISLKVRMDDEENTITDPSIFTLTDLKDEIRDINEYLEIGPKQEFYMSGKACELSFSLLNWDTKAYKLYLGMKAPDGGEAKIVINGNVIDITNSADCYYDISNYINVSELPIGTTKHMLGKVSIVGDSGLTALTNLKVVGLSKYDLGYPENVQPEQNTPMNTARLYMVSNLFLASLIDEDNAQTPAVTPSEEETSEIPEETKGNNDDSQNTTEVGENESESESQQEMETEDVPEIIEEESGPEVVPDDPEAESPVLEKEAQTIEVASKSMQVVYSSEPFYLDASAEGKLSYSSSNGDVLRVNRSGFVTTKGAGTAKITIKAAATETKKSASTTITVKVVRDDQIISAVIAKKTFKSKAVSKNKQVYSIGAVTTGNGKLTYKVLNGSKYVKVNARGKVTVKKGTPAGTYEIRVTAAKTRKYYKAVKVVKVVVK